MGTRSTRKHNAPVSKRKGKAPSTKTLKPWTLDSGNSLVGQSISVSWPSDNTDYQALVLEYYPRKRQHKIIYIEDDSIEVLELGFGPGQREWNYLGDDVKHAWDELIGKNVVLIDQDSDDVEWFHFMRSGAEDEGGPFTVTVIQKLDGYEDEEISGPRKKGVEPRVYRVIYQPNDYLANIDFASTDYDVVDDEVAAAEPEAKEVAKEAPSAKDTVRESQRAERDAEMDDVFPEEDDNELGDEKEGDDYIPSKDVDPDEDSDAPTVEPESSSRRVHAEVGSSSHARKSRKAVAADPDPDEPTDIDMDKVAKVVSADRMLSVDRYELKSPKKASKGVELDGGDVSSSSADQDPTSRGFGEGSVGTQETRDEPLDRSGMKEKKRRPAGPTASALFPEVFEDDGHDTASDEEKLGWVSKEERGGGEAEQSQVGDYISLDTGTGGPPRKAFVEAYLPETGTHFVAFCDTKGGNMQVKLTEHNHTVLGEDDVNALARNASAVAAEEGGGRSSPEVEETKPRATKRRRSSSVAKTRKRAMRSTQEIKGKAAGKEICGRCISIVWPGENLVYVALVLGYSSVSTEHQIVYMVDHCIETLNLKYREWNLLPREKEPWISTGMVGKRLYVFWTGEYDDEKSQVIARKVFGDDTKVPYEAYVLSYVGDGKYKVIYPSTEDTEVRELVAAGEDVPAIEKDWDLLDEGASHVGELPIIGWTD